MSQPNPLYLRIQYAMRVQLQWRPTDLLATGTGRLTALFSAFTGRDPWTDEVNPTIRLAGVLDRVRALAAIQTKEKLDRLQAEAANDGGEQS